jgi:hypothetical protein
VVQEVKTTANVVNKTRAVEETAEVLENSGPIAKSLGAASRAEMIAKKLGLNINSATTRQVLNSLDMTVTDFISKYRAGSIRGGVSFGVPEHDR